ncbi:protein kinase sgk-1 (Partial), partial [Seminavis robusta]|eukprot:Sro3604_g349590.1 protein kinase sgk-1 (349) ;mRNA; r:2-1173
MSTSCIITPEPSSGATSVTSSDMRTLSSCSSLQATSTHSFQVPGKAPKAMMLPRSASTHGIPSKTNNNKSGLARQKRNSWMRSSVVRRAAAVVDEEVAALCDKSPFLNSLTDRSNDIALFHRSEIQLGKMLGRGGFAEVYTVSDFSIDSSDITQFFDATEARRRACKAAVTSSSSGRPNYAIKCLRKKLLSNTREFQHAAIDLAVESKYLAALSHRHIIKTRALTKGGSAAFRTGKHDDFFIIMDHLQETLENRLQRWQQRHASPSSGEDADGSTATTTHPLLVAGANPPPHYYQRTLRYAHQIADALNYLHDKSIVYRDLKPSNLGFRERDVIQLFDFGLCRELPKPK